MDEHREQMQREWDRRRELERQRDERWARYYGVPKTQRLSFFDLPRELRDLVYHHLWRLLKPCICQGFPESELVLQLRYEGHYDISSTHGEREDWPGTSSRFPIAIIASKQFLYEALEQYLRKAEWYFYGSNFYSHNLPKMSYLAPLDITCKMPQRLTVDAGNLSAVEEPRPTRPIGLFGKKDIEKTAEVLRKWQMGDSKYRIQCLRVFGHTYGMPSSLVGPWVQAPHVARNLWKFFEGIDIPRFQVDVVCESGMRCQSYIVTGRGEGEQLQVEMTEDWRRRRDNVASPFRYFRVDSA
jgi:hypothetical protein